MRILKVIFIISAILLLLLPSAISASEEDKINKLQQNIVAGGPPPDGIPPLENPEYISIKEADLFLEDQDAVFILEGKREVYIYPQSIMVWHEIVNEVIDNRKISITYCPLTASAIAYYGKFSGIESTFGTSGKLVNSNLIMYDRATESYWPQIYGRAINGQAEGEKLDKHPLTWTRWELIKDKYKEANVLSRETGFNRDYNSDPYGAYTDNKDAPDNYYFNDNLYFNVLSKNDILSPKEIVVAGEYDDQHFAILKSLVKKDLEVEFLLDGQKITAIYDPALDTVRVYQADKNEMIVVYDVMWFAWHAYYPEIDARSVILW